MEVLEPISSKLFYPAKFVGATDQIKGRLLRECLERNEELEYIRFFDDLNKNVLTLNKFTTVKEKV